MMPRNFLIFIFFSLFGLTGCGALPVALPNPQSEPPLVASPKLISVSPVAPPLTPEEIARPASSTVSSSIMESPLIIKGWDERPPAALYVVIKQYLRQGQYLVEIFKPPLLQLPKPLLVSESFEREQLTRYFQLGNIYFSLVQRPTFNDSRFSTSSAREAAVFYARKHDTRWHYFFPIQDAGTEIVVDRITSDEAISNTVENTPLYFWNEGSVLQLLVTDIRGAGSGEGTAKWLTSTDGGKTWRIVKCFYYTPDRFFDSSTAKRLPFVDALQRYLSLSLGPYNQQYHFNTSTGNFENVERAPNGQVSGTVVEPSCKDIVLP